MTAITQLVGRPYLASEPALLPRPFFPAVLGA